MEERRQELQRQIEMYWRFLATGVSTSEAVSYLKRIMEAKAELERFERAHPN
jgi:hypothetical protein